MSPRRLGELTPHERRRAIANSLARCLVSCIAILVLYLAVPFDERAIDAAAIVILALGIALFVSVLWWQFQRISRSELPQLQAFETVIVAVPLFIVVFSATYLGISNVDTASFTEKLDHVSSLYFTVVTLGTVGFGDIAPRTHAARLVVAAQVLLDLALIALLVRAVVEVSRRRLSENPPDDPEPSD